VTDPLRYLFGLEQFGIKFGLDNIRTLIDDLDHPEQSFRSLHIAGTNGKGSVTAMADAVLRAGGLRSARYTSPHLLDLSERFVIDGQPVRREALVAVVADLRNRIDRLLAAGKLQAQPTFFEVTTAAALELFRQAQVQVAVIEVGLGGRLDSTNVITPVASAITSIAFDHEQYLGRTLAAIAAEKAGIIKPHVPVVLGSLPAEAEKTIVNIARSCEADVVRAGDGVSVERVPQARGGMPHIRLRTPTRDYGELSLSLHGTHQIGNAVVAVRLIELLEGTSIGISPEAIARGLSAVNWPGRLDHRRLADGREMILDAAHNPAGAATLAAYLEETLDAKPPLVFAAMGDKDVAGMFESLLPAVSAVVVTRTSSSRSAAPEALAQRAAAVSPGLPVVVRPVLLDALEEAWSRAPVIVVAGSIFLLADVMKSARWP
jgi:dihydrofolate synthase/folylpolyglutamate synthase